MWHMSLQRNGPFLYEFLHYPWLVILVQNNGVVEGKINKLKLMKRMGYGRAGFALLRQRVLHAL